MPLLKSAADNYLLMNPNECVSQAEDVDKYPMFRVQIHGVTLYILQFPPKIACLFLKMCNAIDYGRKYNQ